MNQYRVSCPACFAPSITSEKLYYYKEVANEIGGEIGEAMDRLIVMINKFWETPSSNLPTEMIPLSGAVKDGKICMAAKCTPLEGAEISRISDVVPWDYVLNAMGQLFDTITIKELRNAAFHLLWYARELNNNREPMTQEVLI